MPRAEKDAFDWSVTYSPEEDFDKIPDWINKLLESRFITHCVAITERHGADEKWHFHAAIRIKRSYKSDYKWWQKYTTDKSPELEVHYHDQICGLAGGYLSKSEPGDVRVLLTTGFTDEDIELGKSVYGKGQLRKKIRDFTESRVGISSAKWNAAIGATIAETGCSGEEADGMLAQLGFACEKSAKNWDLHASMYMEWKRSRLM